VQEHNGPPIADRHSEAVRRVAAIVVPDNNGSQSLFAAGGNGTGGVSSVFGFTSDPRAPPCRGLCSFTMFSSLGAAIS